MHARELLMENGHRKRVGFKHAVKTEMTLQADSLVYVKMQKQKYTYVKKDG